MNSFTEVTRVAPPARLPTELRNPWFNPPRVTVEVAQAAAHYLQGKGLDYNLELITFMREVEE